MDYQNEDKDSQKIDHQKMMTKFSHALLAGVVSEPVTQFMDQFKMYLQEIFCLSRFF